MVDVSQEVLNKAKKLLVKLSKSWKGGVTMGRVMTLDGEVTHGVDYTACHAWLNHAFAGYRGDRWAHGTKMDMDKTFLTLSCHSKGRSNGICSEAAHEAIILWMASDECPLSKFILNRDDKDSLLNGGIIILSGEGGAGHNEAMWLCKVLRYGVEGGQALDVWHELYKAGVNGTLAVLVASHVRSYKGATFGYTGPEGHSTVFGGYGSGTVRAANLLRGKTNPKADNTSSIFSDPSIKKGKTIGQINFQNFCKPVKKSDGWGGTVKGAGADKETFINQILELQRELEAELGVESAPKEPNENTVYLDLDL